MSSFEYSFRYLHILIFYNKRILLATIRDKGLCPCPRCLVLKSKLDRLGLCRDMSTRINKFREFMADRVASARRAIYSLAKSIHSTAVENLLKEFSGIPTLVSVFVQLETNLLITLQNAFVDRLSPGFNPSRMLVVDLLHEFELGVWKTLFTHLIRILCAASSGSDDIVVDLDRR